VNCVADFQPEQNPLLLPLGQIGRMDYCSQMSSLDTFVEFEVSFVGLFQLMTAGMLENNAWPFLHGFRIYTHNWVHGCFLSLDIYVTANHIRETVIPFSKKRWYYHCQSSWDSKQLEWR
jgi:hypothetical protein